MATHLVKAGYNVTGFDLYAPSLQRFAEAGGIPARSLSDSAKDKPFYICMVASAVQLQGLMFEGNEPLVDGLAPSLIVWLVIAASCRINQATVLIASSARQRDDIPPRFHRPSYLRPDPTIDA